LSGAIEKAAQRRPDCFVGVVAWLELKECGLPSSVARPLSEDIEQDGLAYSTEAGHPHAGWLLRGRSQHCGESPQRAIATRDVERLNAYSWSIGIFPGSFSHYKILVIRRDSNRVAVISEITGSSI
jgi:hypothetical protein